MEYHDQPMQFISSHYFKVKSKDDAKYRIILNMIVALTYLPSVLLPVISFLTIFYIYPTICCNIKEYLKIDGNNRLSHIKQLPYTYNSDQLTQTKIIKKWKRYQLGCAFLTSCAVTVGLIILHFASASEFINYGNDILHDEEYIIFGLITYPHIHATLSCFLIATTIIVAIVFSTCKWNIVSLTATSFSVNIIYIVSYFFPTMLLAFIHDPLLTIFTCFMIIAVIGFAYTLLWSAGSIILSKSIDRLIPLQSTFRFNWFFVAYSFMILATGYSLFFLLTLIIDMISLGSFSDFQALQNDMIVPILIGGLTYFFLKPAHKYVSKYVSIRLDEDKEKDNIIYDSETNEVSITINQLEETKQMEDQNDENTIV